MKNISISLIFAVLLLTGCSQKFDSAAVIAAYGNDTEFKKILEYENKTKLSKKEAEDFAM